MDSINYFKILEISEDSSNYKIQEAIKRFEKNKILCNEQINGITKSKLIKIYNEISRWYQSRLKQTVIIMDNKKTCEILGINEANDEQLVGIVRYISNGTCRTKQNCDRLCKAIMENDNKTINKILVGENDDEYSLEQLQAIYIYSISEDNKTRNSHIKMFNKLLSERCVLTTTIERELSEIYRNKSKSK